MNREELVRYDGEWYDANIVDCLLDEKDEEIEDLLRQNRELCQALQVMYSKEEYGKLQKEIESLKAQIAEAIELSIELQKRNKAIADNAISNVESYKSMRDAEIESLKASHYAEMVDAGMRERRLQRSLWLARAERAKEHLWHDVKPDGSPKEDYNGSDWVLVQLREVNGIELIPRVAEYRRHLKRWVFISEEYDTENSHEFRYLRDKCVVIGWRDIDFAYYGKKFFVQQEINKNVERKCLEKAEEYR